MNPKSDDSTLKKIHSLTPSSTVPTSIPPRTSLIRRTKFGFSQFFKNDRYSYLSPLKHMFRLKKNLLEKSIQPDLASKPNSKTSHEYVNEKFVGKIQKDSIGKVRKSNFVISSSSASAAVPTSSVIKKNDAVSKKAKKGRKMSAVKQRKHFNLKAKEQFVLNAIQNSKEMRTIEIPNPIYRSVKVTKQTNRPSLPPPLPPPLTPFLKNQRLIENKFSPTKNVNNTYKKFNKETKSKL